MTDRMTIGKAGEAIALEYLLRKGLKLLARNVHLGHDEIDLVMEDKRFCRVIEVKTMTDASFCMPFEKVDRDKRKHLLHAAKRIIYTFNIKKEIVFDIVSIIIDDGKIWIKYLPDAFSPNRY